MKFTGSSRSSRYTRSRSHAKAGEMAIGFVGTLLIFIVATLILLVFSTGMFGIIKDSSSSSVCKASAIANSVGNTVTAGSDVVKIDCPVQYVKITENPAIPPKDTKVIDGDKPLTESEKKRLDKLYFFDPVNKKKESKTITPEELVTYRVNEEVALEMKSCWDNMGNGRLNLFSSWFSYLATEEGKGWLKSWIPHKANSPTVCVICAKITLDDGVLSKVLSKTTTPSLTDSSTNPDTLIYWLTHTPIPQTSISYYEYLQDSVNSDIFGKTGRSYEYNNEPIAIIFTRTNKHAVDSILSMISGMSSNPITGEGGESTVAVVPYKSEYLEDYCDLLAN